MGGIRLRLALAISIVSLGVLAGAFIALRETTASDLRNRIDRELGEQYREFRQQALPGTGGPAQLQARSEHFLRGQRYQAKSRIFVIQLGHGTRVTNEREVVERELERDGPRERRREREGAGRRRLLAAPFGLATLSLPETGPLRVLSEPVRQHGRQVGVFRVGDPLRSVEEARSGINDAFLVVGIAALLVSIAVAAWLATLITRPLRRMAGVAGAVDAGELDHRIGEPGGRDEVRVLAESFDHMLDRLERAFRRQQEFVSDASHELRTPLTVLRGHIELLERESDPEERRRATETVLRELDHMNRLIEDMLTLAGLDSGELVRVRQIDLADFLEDLRRDLPLLGERDYRVEGPAGGSLETDPDRLNQVVRNLIRNAVAHTNPGERITVTLTPRGRRLEFAVADQGPGIPAVELERVFDRFHRAGADRYGGHSGTGLGLAIARAIVEAHGGWIRAESPPGGGATVRFELPGYTAAPTENGARPIVGRRPAHPSLS
jgi:signal transduction histidine kinase